MMAPYIEPIFSIWPDCNLIKQKKAKQSPFLNTTSNIHKK